MSSAPESKHELDRATSAGRSRSGRTSGVGELRVNDSSPASRTGVWVVLAATTMTFAAFTSAMIVRKSSGDWRQLTLPPVLYGITAVMLASSVALECARKYVAAFARGETSKRFTAMVYFWLTLGLGELFLAGLSAAWLKLISEKVYLATGPADAFFYLFTTFCAVHVVGGMGGLIMVFRRFSKPVPALRTSTLNAVSYYWHGMTVLWLGIILLLRAQ
jgi:cytochrome c oxidase subunit III